MCRNTQLKLVTRLQDMIAEANERSNEASRLLYSATRHLGYLRSALEDSTSMDSENSNHIESEMELESDELEDESSIDQSDHEMDLEIVDLSEEESSAHHLQSDREVGVEVIDLLQDESEASPEASVETSAGEEFDPLEAERAEFLADLKNGDAEKIPVSLQADFKTVLEAVKIRGCLLDHAYSSFKKAENEGAELLLAAFSSPTKCFPYWVAKKFDVFKGKENKFREEIANICKIPVSPKITNFKTIRDLVNQFPELFPIVAKKFLDDKEVDKKYGGPHGSFILGVILEYPQVANFIDEKRLVKLQKNYNLPELPPKKVTLCARCVEGYGVEAGNADLEGSKRQARDANKQRREQNTQNGARGGSKQ